MCACVLPQVTYQKQPRLFEVMPGMLELLVRLTEKYNLYVLTASVLEVATLVSLSAFCLLWLSNHLRPSYETLRLWFTLRHGALVLLVTLSAAMRPHGETSGTCSRVRGWQTCVRQSDGRTSTVSYNII